MYFDAIVLWLRRLKDPLLSQAFISQVFQVISNAPATGRRFYVNAQLVRLGDAARDSLIQLCSLVEKLCLLGCDEESVTVSLQREVAAAVLGPALCQLPTDLRSEGGNARPLHMARIVFEILLEHVLGPEGIDLTQAQFMIFPIHGVMSPVVLGNLQTGRVPALGALRLTQDLGEMSEDSPRSLLDSARGSGGRRMVRPMGSGGSSDNSVANSPASRKSSAVLGLDRKSSQLGDNPRRLKQLGRSVSSPRLVSSSPRKSLSGRGIRKASYVDEQDESSVRPQSVDLRMLLRNSTGAVSKPSPRDVLVRSSPRLTSNASDSTNLSRRDSLIRSNPNNSSESANLSWRESLIRNHPGIVAHQSSDETSPEGTSPKMGSRSSMSLHEAFGRTFAGSPPASQSRSAFFRATPRRRESLVSNALSRPGSRENPKGEKLVETVILQYEGGNDMKIEVEANWSALRVMLMYQANLESRSIVFATDEDMTIRARGPGSNAQANVSLSASLLKTNTARTFEMIHFRPTLRSGHLSTRTRSFNLGPRLRSSAALRSTSNLWMNTPKAKSPTPSSAEEEDSTLTPVRRLSISQNSSTFDFCRVVILGDCLPRGQVAALLPGNAEQVRSVNWLSEWKYKGIVVSQIELESNRTIDLVAAEKALYVVALNASSSGQDELILKLRGFARLIASATGSMRPKIICVVEDADADMEQRVRSAFRGTVSKIVVREVRASLLASIEEHCPNVATLYLSLEERLLNHGMDSPVIAMTQVRKIAAQLNLDLPALNTALQYLADRGCILYFPHHALLNTQLIVNVTWLLERLTSLILFSNNIENGIATLSALQTIWQTSSTLLNQVTIRALAEFGCVFVNVLPSSADMVVQMVVPAALPSVQTTPPRAPRVVYSRRFEMSFCDQRSWDRITASLFYHPELTVSEAWSTGLVLSSSLDGVSSFVIISCRFNENAYDGDVTIRSSSDYTAFRSVVRLVEHFFQNNQRIRVERRVGCSSCQAAGAWFGLSDVLHSMRKHLPMPCSNCKMVFSGDLRESLVPDFLLNDAPTFENLEYKEEIGRGAFGVVRRAITADTKEAVAVKHMLREHVGADEFMTSYWDMVQEIRVWQSVATSTNRKEGNVVSPYVVKILGVTKDFPPLVVMEYLQHSDLGRVLHSPAKGAPSLSPAQRTHIALDLAMAVSYLHSLDPPVLHRDVRSPNVFLASLDAEHDVMAKLGDFGCAQQMSGEMTQALPTFQWMAPEVLVGTSYDLSADVYSFGMVLYELLMCKIPFAEFDEFFTQTVNQEGETVMLWKEMAVRDAIRNGLRPKVTGEWGGEDSKLVDLMRKCWGKPAERPSFVLLAHTLATGTRFEGRLNIPTHDPTTASISSASSPLPTTATATTTVRSSSGSEIPLASKAALSRMATLPLVSNPEKLFELGHPVDACVLDEAKLVLWLAAGKTLTAIQLWGDKPGTELGPEWTLRLKQDITSLILATQEGMLIMGKGDGYLQTVSLNKIGMPMRRGIKKYRSGSHNAISHLLEWPADSLLFSADSKGSLIVWRYAKKGYDRLGTIKLPGAITSLAVHIGPLTDVGAVAPALLVCCEGQLRALPLDMFDRPLSMWTQGRLVPIFSKVASVHVVNEELFVCFLDRVSVFHLSPDYSGRELAKASMLSQVTHPSCVAFPISRLRLCAVGDEEGSIWLVFEGAIVRQRGLTPDAVFAVLHLFDDSFISVSRATGVVSVWLMSLIHCLSID